MSTKKENTNMPWEDIEIEPSLHILMQRVKSVKRQRNFIDKLKTIFKKILKNNF